MRTRLPGEANAWGLFIRRLAVTLTIFASVANCNLLKKKTDADAGDDAEAAVVETVDAAPAPTAPAALATNEGDVARFPDETKLADVAATTLRPFNVREAPPAGDLVLLIPKATVVTQIAQRDKFFLITFDNPNAPGTRLMGWVHRDAFSAVVVDAGPLVCKTGEVALVGDTPFCGRLCNVDTDCPAGQACRGSGTKLLPTESQATGCRSAPRITLMTRELRRRHHRRSSTLAPRLQPRTPGPRRSRTCSTPACPSPPRALPTSSPPRLVSARRGTSS